MVHQKVTVSATAGGTGIAFTNSLSADTPGGHIVMKLTEFTSHCNVSSFDFSLDREQIENHKFPCGCTSASNGIASFKTHKLVISTAPDLLRFSSLRTKLRWPLASSVLPLRRISLAPKSACISTRSVQAGRHHRQHCFGLHRSTCDSVWLQLQRYPC